jgi:putative transposase
MPYEYRRMTPEQREAVVRLRAAKGYPLHSPPHPINEKRYYLLTAVNFEHRHIMTDDERRSTFQKTVLEKFREAEVEISGWVFLGNHYHLLGFVPNFPKLSFIFNGLHGATSRQWNLEDGLTGKRKVWYKFNDRMIRGEAHYYATLNYIHYNPVKHGYTKRMDQWEWTSFSWYLEEMGRDWLVEIWKKYPIKNYGDKWDIF